MHLLRMGSPLSCAIPVVPGLLLLLFTACAISGPGVEVYTAVEDEENFIRFETNDSSFCQSMYYILEEEDVAYPLERAEVKITKDSGYASADFGLIFGYLDSDNYFLFSMDINGNYSIRKKESGMYTDLEEWSFSQSLDTGYGTPNSIVIENNSGNYELLANGQPLASVETGDSSAGKMGYFVYIASPESENFPLEPVSVKFEIISK